MKNKVCEIISNIFCSYLNQFIFLYSGGSFSIAEDFFMESSIKNKHCLCFRLIASF